MKLLVLTQAIDLDDPVLGFFHRWVEEFAKHTEHIEVVCLKLGRSDLPKNVRVHSLGKEGGPSRLKYLWRFYRNVWSLRGKYDAVFVHMNEEYVLLGGLFWRLLGKKIILWRNFKTGSWMTPIACRLADTVCATSKESFTQRYPNAVIMPVGIDTDLFALGVTPPPSDTLLFFGRLDEIKRPDLFLQALALLTKQGIAYRAQVYGEPTPGNEAYAHALKERFASLAQVSFHAGVSNAEAPAVYQQHAVYINLTASGSFDKTIGEALASGGLVVCANDALRGVVPEECLVGATAESVARGIKAALALDQSARTALRAQGRAYVEREHSLQLLAERLVNLIT